VTRIGQLECRASLAEAQVRLAEINRLLGPGAALPSRTKRAAPSRAAVARCREVLEALRGLSPELKDARLAVARGRVRGGARAQGLQSRFQRQRAYMNRGGLDPMWLAGVAASSCPCTASGSRGQWREAEARLRESERRCEAVELQLRFRTQERLAQLEAAAGDRPASSTAA